MRAGAGLWLALVLASGLGCVALFGSGHAGFQTNLLALLPAESGDPLRQRAYDRITAQAERRIIALIHAPEAAERIKAATIFRDRLRSQAAVESVVLGYQDNPDEGGPYTQLLFEHRFGLLSRTDRALLERGETEPFVARARNSLFGLGATRSHRFIDDPFGLAESYARELNQATPASGLRLDTQGRFETRAQSGRYYSVVFIEFHDSPFNFDAQAAQTSALDHALEQMRAAAPGANAILTGMQRHAAAATAQARREISIIGSGSALGILLLMFWAFGSLRPFLLSGMVIAGGCLFALTLTVALFGQVHVLTLVFGASIAGVAIDYCFHFFARRWREPDPARALSGIRRAISMGLVTSMLAYLGMALTPLPALQQMGFFAAMSLLGAWTGVILLLPALAGQPPRQARPLPLARRWWSFTGRPVPTSAGTRLPVLLLLLSLPAALYLTSPRDDIALLNSSPAPLLQAERLTQRLLGTATGGRALLVTGDSVTDVLQREAEFRAASPGGDDLQAISRYYPAPPQQRRNHALLADTLYAKDGPAATLLAELGFPDAVVQNHLQTFAKAETQPLGLEQWLSAAQARTLRPLWLPEGGEFPAASMLRLPPGAPDAATRRLIAADTRLQLLDQRADISESLAQFRQRAAWLLGAAYLLAGLLLWRLFGLGGALAVLAAPLTASAVTALLLTALGAVFSLFNLMAMVLLLGLGMDYGIFLRMADEDRVPAMAAVGLSAATTLLAFGLLAFSATPALQGFGLTLALGLSLTFLLASVLASGGAQPRASSA